MRMWSVHLQRKELDQLVWNLGVHVRSDCKEWLEEPVITDASNLCSASRWNLMTLTVRWIALQNRSLCIDQLLQGSPRMLCLPFLNLYLLMDLVQLCSLWRIQASLGQLVIVCLSVGQAMSVIAHCNALVGQAGSVIVGALDSDHNALLPPWHDMAWGYYCHAWPGWPPCKMIATCT